MRIFAAAAMAACICPVPALAAPQTSALASPLPAAAPQAEEAPGGSVRVAMSQQTLAPGGKLAEHRQAGERYLYVVAGQLKVSNLVTGEEQVVGAGRMAAEQPGDWHVAVAMGGQPATFYVIDRGPDAGAAATANNQGN